MNIPKIVNTGVAIDKVALSEKTMWWRSPWNLVTQRDRVAPQGQYEDTLTETKPQDLNVDASTFLAHPCGRPGTRVLRVRTQSSKHILLIFNLRVSETLF